MPSDDLAAVLLGGTGHESQLLDDLCAGEAILSQPTVRLELEQATKRIGTKDAVDDAALETEGVETPL